MNPTQQSEIPEQLHSPDWLLAGFDANREIFQFARVSRQTYVQSAFLDHRIQPRPEETLSVGADEVDTVIRQMDSNPAACLFHTAFCASTLLATCLQQNPGVLVLREPLVLSRLADLSRGVASADEAFGHLQWRILRLLDRTYGQDPVVIKPSNYANTLIPAYLSGEPEGSVKRRCVLLSSGLNSLLVSVLKKRPEAEQLLPAFTHNLLRDTDYAQRVDLPPVDSLNLLQQAVVFWHCQRYQFQRVRQLADASAVLPLSARQFLENPARTLTEISAFLNLGLSPGQLEQVVRCGAFRQHSKTGSDYGPEQQRSEAAETASRYAADIRSAIHWAGPLLEKLPPQPMNRDEDPLE